jgi:hypothetical protein
VQQLVEDVHVRRAAKQAHKHHHRKQHPQRRELELRV